MRIGIGYDIHPLKRGRRLVLGGVTVPFHKGLDGHSDGDALVHAIVDAVLGASGSGDIGDLFSDSDPRTRGADSFLFVKKTMQTLRRKKIKILHIDSIVLAEAPHFGPYKEKMRKNIARAFGVPVARVGLKAKTNEGFGPVGRGQAIACQSVVLLKGKS